MNKILIPTLLMGMALGGNALACDKATDAAGPADFQTSHLQTATIQTVGWAQAEPMRVAVNALDATETNDNQQRGTDSNVDRTQRSDSDYKGTELGTGAVGSSTIEDRNDRAGTDLNDADATAAGLAPFWVALATVGTAMLALGLIFFNRKRFANRNNI